MRYIIFIVLSLILFFSCSNNKKQNKFISSLDSLLQNYRYSEVVNLASEKLRNKGNVLDSSYKADIYWRYAFAVSMKNNGAIHFTILDSLKKYGVDSLFFKKRDEMIERAQKKLNVIRENLNKGEDPKKAIESLDKVLLEYPTFNIAKQLKDSLEKVENNKND